MAPTESRLLAFLDVLGLRRALSLGKEALAARKVRELRACVEEVVPRFPSMRAHGSSDFFLLWGETDDDPRAVAHAACEIYRAYWDRNQNKITDLDGTLLLRGGLAHGTLEMLTRYDHEISYALPLGSAIARAYEAQTLGRGMRLFFGKGATTHLRRGPSDPVSTHKTHDERGSVLAREVHWAGSGADVAARVERARRLFRKSLSEFRKKELPEAAVIHYQQTLCCLLRALDDPAELSRYLTFYHQQTRYHEYLAPVWADAWVSLLQPLNKRWLEDSRDEIWDRFMTVAGSRGNAHVATHLHRRSRWRPLRRLLKEGCFRLYSS